MQKASYTLTIIVLMLLGRLNLKHKVQVRTLRATHPDSHYCSALLKYLKGLCLELAKAAVSTSPTMVVRYISMDDKAKVILWLLQIVCCGLIMCGCRSDFHLSII